MKKLILSLAAVAFAATGAFAQFEQGSILISGGSDLGFMSNSEKTLIDGDEPEGSEAETSTEFGLGLKGGYFVSDGIAVGLGVNFGTETFETTDEDGDDINQTVGSFTIGPWARYYLEMGLFAEAQANFGSVINSEADETPSIFGWGLGVGYAIMLADAVALEPSVSYMSTSLNSDVEDENGDEVTRSDRTNSFGLNIGVTVFLGN